MLHRNEVLKQQTTQKISFGGAQDADQGNTISEYGYVVSNAILPGMQYGLGVWLLCCALI